MSRFFAGSDSDSDSSSEEEVIQRPQVTAYIVSTFGLRKYGLNLSSFILTYSFTAK